MKTGLQPISPWQYGYAKPGFRVPVPRSVSNTIPNLENIDLSPIIEQGLPLDAFRSEDLAHFFESQLGRSIISDHENQLVFPTLTDEQKVI